MAAVYRFVLSVRPTTAPDGSTTQFLFSGDDWTTKPTDTPANTAVRGLLLNPGTLQRNLFSGKGVTGAIKPTYGNFVLANKAPVKGQPGLLDDWLGYGLAGAELLLYRGPVGAAFPAGYKVVQRSFCHSFWADESAITIRQRDALQLLDKPVVIEGFAGTGGIEGTGAVAKRKQFVATDPGLIEPILVDAIRLIYYVQSTGTGGVHGSHLVDGPGVELSPFDVFDRGVEITRDAAVYASRAELEAVSPAPGHVRYWFGPASVLYTGQYDGPVYFRLGSKPDGDLRVFAAGYPTDADAQRLGVLWGSFNAAHFALRAGVPLADVSLTQADLPVAAVLVDDETTYAEMLADQALAQQGWFGFDRLGKFRSGYLRDPIYEDPTPVSVYTFTEAAIKDFRREVVGGMEVPQASVAVTAGQAWPCQVAGGASNTLIDYLSRRVWSSFSGQSAATKLRDPGAEHQAVNMRNRRIQNELSRTRWLQRYFFLYGGARNAFGFTVPLSDEVLDLELHDVVTLQHSRFGLQAGRNFRIVSITVDCSADVPFMRLVVWGGEPGTYTATAPSVGGTAFVSPMVRYAAVGDVTGYGYGRITITGGSPFASVGDVTGFGAGRLLNDPNWAAVSMLVQGGTAASTTITDLSATGGTATINAGGAWSATQQVFGRNMIRCTSNTMDADPFTSTGGTSRFTRASGQALTIECYLYLVTVENVSRAAQLWYWANGAIGRVAELFVQGTSRTLTMRLESASEVTYSTLAANTLHFLQLVVATDNTFSLRVNGTEVGTGTFPVDTYAGAHDFYVGSNPTADGATTTADYYLSPLRWTLGVERAGGVPAAQFPVG